MVGELLSLAVAVGLVGLMVHDWRQQRKALQAPTDPSNPTSVATVKPSVRLADLAQPLHFAKDALLSIRKMRQVRRLRLREWWWMLDEAFHWMLVGETGKGKSTLAKAMMSFYAQQGMVFLIDPHYSPDDWPIRAIGAGRNYAEADAAFVALEKELNRRYDKRANPKDDDAVDLPLWVFIDEYLSCVANCPNASRVFKALVNEGRKVGIHLVVLVQVKTVKALGIEGEGDTRRNLGKVLFGSYAVAVDELEWLGDFQYPAAIDVREGQPPIGIDTSELPSLHGTIKADCVWQPDLEIQPIEAAGLLTANHVLVAKWLAEEPNISNRQIAKRLWGGNGGGKNNAKAQELRSAVAQVFTCSLASALSVDDDGTAPETDAGEQVNGEQPETVDA
jgi:hypothetical protein